MSTETLSQKLETLPLMRDVVDCNGLMAKKSLGQNFLLDSNITDKIVRLSLDTQGLKDFSNANVFEIGPGPGGLTRSILRAEPQTLTVIEMDDRCIKIMEEIKSVVGKRINIINGDALKIDITSFEQSSKHIISNLPYNISVPLLTNWLFQIENFESLTLMFQKEVAERIIATPGNKNYGRLSIIAQLQCKIDRLFDINPNCFLPAPKIWSTVLLFRPLHSQINIESLKKIEKLTALAFGQRRKMVRQSLKSIPDIESKLESLGLVGTMRAEEISPQDYLKLSQIIP